ncbi:urease accessory protein UreD [Sporolactobacillus terrae]|uniref:urease accessory protein UreD n=1 Tax=Sporolactobacillus terrae TaxID=269673 RepID=UPI001118CA3A|nr:urease accessory protein UreD [Sporolactobacillus terrae]
MKSWIGSLSRLFWTKSMGVKRGELELLFEKKKKKNKTIASHVYFHGALKVIRPQYDRNSGQIKYILVNLGGGYLQGDHYTIQLSLKDNAEVQLTTQAATKIYKSDKDGVFQQTEIHMKNSSMLEYIPNPIIPYKDSNYRQIQHIEMDHSSSLFLSEILTSGYDPNDVKFSFKQVDLTTKVIYDNQLSVFDRLRFFKEDALTSEALMGDFTHLGSIIAIYPSFHDSDLNDLRKWLPYNNELISGVTKLSIPGLMIRILGYRTQDIEQQIQSTLSFFRQKWQQVKQHHQDF